MNDTIGRVVIGMDTHKRSVTIEVMTGDPAARRRTCHTSESQPVSRMKPAHRRQRPAELGQLVGQTSQDPPGDAVRAIAAVSGRCSPASEAARLSSRPAMVPWPVESATWAARQRQ